MKKKIKDVEHPKTCVIYVRVSTDMQAEKGFSLDAQIGSSQEFCKREGLEVLKVFREEGQSAKTADRTKLQQMQRYCLENMNKVGYVVVWKVDRFSRNQYDHAMLKKFFRDCGTELKSVTEVIEDTTVGKFTEGMLAVQAQYEIDVYRERTLSGMRRKAHEGHWPGLAPWGYINMQDDKVAKRWIEPDPQKAPLVKFIFEEFSRTTISYRELAKRVSKLTDARSKHGFNISKQLVFKILRNPIHCGRIVMPRFKVVAKGRHEPIISEELFDEVQLIMNGGKRNKKSRHQDNADFPLRGVACICGGHISGGFSTGRNKKYAYYGCINDCPYRRAIPKLDLEAAFTQFLEYITPDAVILEALREAIIVAYEKDRTDGIQQARKLDTRLKKIEQEMDRLLDMKLKGLLDDEDFVNKNEKLKAEKRGLLIDQRNLENPAIGVEKAVEFGIRVVQEFPLTWEMLEPGELRVLRGLFFPQNIVFQNGKFKTAELAPIYNVKSENYEQKYHQVTLPGIEPGLTA